MSAAQENVELRENLASLTEQSLVPIAMLAGAIGGFWFLWVGWPGASQWTQVSAWAGTLLLLAGAGAGLLLKERHLSVAAHILVWSSLGAAVCALLTFPSRSTVYVFILPVTFASVLLSQPALLLVAALSLLWATGIGLSWPGAVAALNGTGTPPWPILVVLRLAASGMWLPLVMIALVTTALWISTHALRTALVWVWHGYERARHNELEVREHQVQLKRAMRALDEATHRLERVNYALALTRDRAEEARRLKQQFAQNISHELRTPLNLIVGFTELMTESPEHYGCMLAPAYLRDLNIVHRNACHLKSLVDDVLDLARIEAAQMSIVPEEVDPADLVREAVQTTHSLISARGLALHTAIASGLPRLHIDPTRIRQVLFNLLNNAARFTDQGSVTVRVHQQGNEVLFAVSDTGVGIAPEEMSMIFDEFHQADGTTRRRHGGAGLGLTISRQFVELHGGRIWAESQVGKGSTFVFALPANGAQADGAAAGHPLHPARPAGHENDEPILLAVTRSPSAASLLTRYVQGFQATVLPNLHEAARAVRQLVPQLVVLDQSSAEIAGCDLEDLAREWGLSNTPILSCPLPGEESLRRRLDVNGYLIKPVARESLWSLLRQFGQEVDRVLVVDDNPDFVLLMSRMLEDNPVRRYQVTAASGGREGLDLAARFRPDLVLLDLVLPDLPGPQVVEQIRAMPAIAHTPIVVVSGQDELDDHAALAGSIVMARMGGWRPAEVARCIQGVTELLVSPLPAPPGL